MAERKLPFSLRKGWAGLLLLAVSCGVPAWGAEAPAILRTLNAPLAMTDPEKTRTDSIDNVWEVEAAHEAIAAGFYHVAETILRGVLVRADLAPERRTALSLDLVTALIAQRKADEAAEIIGGPNAGTTPAWRLRRAAVAFLREDFSVVEQVVGDLRSGNLSAADEGWYHFLRAMFWYRDGAIGRADEAMQEAVAASTSTAERALFRLGSLQARFGAGPPSEELLAELRREIESSQGRPVNLRYSLHYAVALHAVGRRDEAVEILVRQRALVPAEEPELRDQTSLLLGLVAEPTTVVGRGAFSDLLINGTNRDFQRAAIVHLASGVPASGGGATDLIQELLRTVMHERPQHPLMDYLLFVSARLALPNDQIAAEDLADELLTRFPGSELRARALALLVNASWTRNRYRTAADYITRLRAVLDGAPSGEARSRRLAVLLGECFFRAGLQPQGTTEDFRNAAEAYGLAQEGLPPDVSRGEIFYQRVMSWIRGDAVENAIALLDGDEAMEINPEDRWQAEWNLARYLQLADREPEAFARVQSLSQLEEVSAGLRLRFLWLVAQLGLKIEDSAATIGRIERLREFISGPSGGAISSDLKERVASNSVLLEAQALLETDNPEAGLTRLEAMQTGEYAETPAGIFSYIVRGRYLAAQNRLVEAQNQLTTLADRFPGSEYASQALFEAALVAMRRGQEYLRDADELLNRIFAQYGTDEPLLFRVLLEQGDIQRQLYQFGYAEQLYLYLENYYPDHPDQIFAQFALANTLLAQVPNDPSKFDAAISRLERLASLPSAPVDLQIAAGFRLGFAWQNRGSVDRAAQIYWQLYTRYLEGGESSPELGANGRYWLARALLEFGQIEERAGRLDNARRSYQAVLAHGLPAPALARGFLARLGNGG